MKDPFIGCLLECIVGIAMLLIFHFCMKACSNIGKEYLVEETGYIHSTGDKERCWYIADAKKKGYKISRISMGQAKKEKKSICKACYSKEKQKEYNDDIANRKKWESRYDDWEEWLNLSADKAINIEKLFVYIEREKGRLHIYGNCNVAEEGELIRVRLDNVEGFDTTCEECVDREYCDFIYKAVYEGIFDSAQIKEIDDDYYF